MIEHLSLISDIGNSSETFVGLKVSNDSVEFHYPGTYNITENDHDLRQEILAILKTISLAKSFSDEKSNFNVSHSKDYQFPLKSFLWIINDYLIYGKYQDYETTEIKGIKGKINWKKTMKFTPAISAGNIVYTDIISTIKIKEDNPLTEIYYYCVQTAIKAIGWLYNIRFDSKGIDYSKLFNKRKYLGIINTALAHAFEDQRIQRLTQMKNIILGLDTDMISSGEFTYGVDSYEYVYERLVDNFFKGIKNISDFYPKATWNLEIDNSTFNSSNLRPDTILIKAINIAENGIIKTQNNVYILDSKYYLFGTTLEKDDLPETSSIQKQITYGDLIKLIYDYDASNPSKKHFDKVYNAFIMPYNKYNNKSKGKLTKNIEYIGIATGNWNKHEKEHEKIVGILIDTKYLIDNWMKNNDDEIDALTKLIEDKITKSNN